MSQLQHSFPVHCLLSHGSHQWEKKTTKPKKPSHWHQASFASGPICTKFNCDCCFNLGAILKCQIHLFQIFTGLDFSFIPTAWYLIPNLIYSILYINNWVLQSLSADCKNTPWLVPELSRLLPQGSSLANNITALEWWHRGKDVALLGSVITDKKRFFWLESLHHLFGMPFFVGQQTRMADGSG